MQNVDWDAYWEKDAKKWKLDIIALFQDKKEHTLKEIYQIMEKRYRNSNIIIYAPLCKNHCEKGHKNQPEWKHKIRGILDELQKENIVKIIGRETRKLIVDYYSRRIEDTNRRKNNMDGIWIFNMAPDAHPEKNSVAEFMQRQNQIDCWKEIWKKGKYPGQPVLIFVTVKDKHQRGALGLGRIIDTDCSGSTPDKGVRVKFLYRFPKFISVMELRKRRNMKNIAFPKPTPGHAVNIIKQLIYGNIRVGPYIKKENLQILLEILPEISIYFNKKDVLNNIVELDIKEFEGRKLLREHMMKERSKSLVRIFKQTLISKECAACGFDFEAIYGELGKGFIEAHHIMPLSMLNGSKSTSLKDFVAVCSNCHSMLHRGKSILDWQELRRIINKDKSDSDE